MSQLTDEQRKRMEENRLKALERRAATLCKKEFTSTNTSVNLTKQNIPHKFRPKNSSSPRFSNKATECNPYFRTQSKISNLTKNSFKIKSEYRNKYNKWRYYRDKFKKNNGSIHKKPADLIWEPKDDCIRGTCVLLNRRRFYVDLRHYHKELVDVFKSIPSSQFDMQTKKWNFLLKDHEKLMASARNVNSALVLPLPRLVLRTFASCTEKRVIKEHDLSSLHLELLDALLPFQIEGVNFGIEKGGRVLIADDMGLGKTIQAIAIVDYFKDWPLLVVAPSSLRYSWKESFDRWLPSTDPYEVTVIDAGKDPIPDHPRIVVISYDVLTAKQSDVVRREFASVILDESHFLKNGKTNRAKAAMAVMAGAKRIVMLSGTPALSRPIELYTQLSSLMPRDFFSFVEFGRRYCCTDRRGHVVGDFKGSSNLEELQLLLEETVMIRRLKSDVAKQLPSKRRQVVVLDPSSVDTSDETLRKLRGMMGKFDDKFTKSGCMARYFDRTGVVKLRAVRQHVAGLLETDDRKFLCFAHHQSVLDGVSRLLEDADVDFVYIDGSVTSERRKDLCDRFQTEEDCRAAVLSIKAAGCGITLTAASLVVFAELFWNPGVLAQAEDRAHRIGQEEPVVVQYLVARGTADDFIWPLLQKKLDVLTKVGLGYEEKGLETSGEGAVVLGDDFFDDVEFDEDEEQPGKRSNID